MRFLPLETLGALEAWGGTWHRATHALLDEKRSTVHILDPPASSCSPRAVQAIDQERLSYIQMQDRDRGHAHSDTHSGRCQQLREWWTMLINWQIPDLNRRGGGGRLPENSSCRSAWFVRNAGLGKAGRTVEDEGVMFKEVSLKCTHVCPLPVHTSSRDQVRRDPPDSRVLQTSERSEWSGGGHLTSLASSEEEVSSSSSSTSSQPGCPKSSSSAQGHHTSISERRPDGFGRADTMPCSARER